MDSIPFVSAKQPTTPRTSVQHTSYPPTPLSSQKARPSRQRQQPHRLLPSSPSPSQVRPLEPGKEPPSLEEVEMLLDEAGPKRFEGSSFGKNGSPKNGNGMFLGVRFATQKKRGSLKQWKKRPTHLAGYSFWMHPLHSKPTWNSQNRPPPFYRKLPFVGDLRFILHGFL